MKKLTLKLDDLAVESFEAGAGTPLRGTVKPHQVYSAYSYPTCGGIGTCGRGDCATVGFDCTHDWYCQMSRETRCGNADGGCWNTLSQCHCGEGGTGDACPGVEEPESQAELPSPEQ